MGKTFNTSKPVDLYEWRDDLAKKSKKRLVKQVYISKNPGKVVTILVEPE